MSIDGAAARTYVVRHMAVMELRKLVAITATLFIIVPAGSLAGETKAAWEWSVEERIALRTDPALARERALKEQGHAKLRVGANHEARPAADAFEGKTHPELFLPHEVFNEFIGLAFLGSPRMGELVRRGWMPEVKGHGLPSDFWGRLRSLSAVYIADSSAEAELFQSRQALTGLSRERTEAALKMKNIDVCRSRAQALAAAREAFGRERFDRFLYEVVAVNMFSMADSLPDASLLRKAAEGCK